MLKENLRRNLIKYSTNQQMLFISLKHFKAIGAANGYEIDIQIMNHYFRNRESNLIMNHNIHDLYKLKT